MGRGRSSTCQGGGFHDVAFSQTDFTDDLEQITVPVLVMLGDDDQIVPDAEFGTAVGKAAEKTAR